MDFHAIIEGLANLGATARSVLPLDSYPDPLMGCLIAIPAGFVLAFWGARLLRTVYVLAFMAAGGALGVRIADESQIDKLIGLVLGAGIAGLAAHLLFRWWVAVTTGLVAVLLVGVLSAPSLSDLLSKYNDYRLPDLGTDTYTLLQPAPDPEQPAAAAWEYLAGLKDFLIEKQPEVLRRTGLLLALLWSLAVLVGLLLPRLTMILGTSLVGVGLLTGGAAVLVQSRWPDIYSAIVASRGWALAAIGLTLLTAVSVQARPRRAAVIPAAQAKPAAQGA